MSEQKVTKKETTAEFLTRHGWRNIGSRRTKFSYAIYWDHPEKRYYNGRGAFTTFQAFALQTKINKTLAHVYKTK